jgi:hypothetical protein
MARRDPYNEAGNRRRLRVLPSSKPFATGYESAWLKS